LPYSFLNKHTMRAGDRLSLGALHSGLRNYLGVSGGIRATPQFGSTATVVREGIGGLDGKPLRVGHTLPVGACEERARLRAPAVAIPDYGVAHQSPLRIIMGYQWMEFSATDRARFLHGTYRITPQSDRMGYRLRGTALQIGSRSLLSEGICHGAVQIPGDGQPIVLLADRQTIGGYPKLGSVLSLDCARLAQCSADAEVSFTALSMESAHPLLHLARARECALQPEACR
jgi:biotin-dependent carboxylase-like uncharacterized protein